MLVVLSERLDERVSEEAMGGANVTEGQVRINRSHATAFLSVRLASFICITDVEPAKSNFLLQLYIPRAALAFYHYFCVVGVTRHHRMGPTVLVAVPVSA